MRPALALPSLLLLVAALGVAVIRQSQRGSFRLQPAGILCAFALFGWLALRCHQSQEAWLGALWLRLITGALAAYLLGAWVITSTRARLFFFGCILLGATFQALWGWGQHHGWWGVPLGWQSEQLRLWYEHGRPPVRGTYLNANHYAWMLNAAGLAAVALAFLGSFRVWSRMVWLGMGSLCLGVSLLSSSRGGAIALLAGLTTLAALAIATLYHGERRQRRWRAAMLLACLALPLLALTSIWRSDASLPMQSQSLLFDHYRMEVWQTALRQSSAAPLLGGGPGSFLYQAREQRVAPAPHDDYFVHNDWLQAAAEFGLPALLLALLVAGCHWFGGLRLYREGVHRLGFTLRSGSHRAAITLAAMAILAATLIHSLFDFNLQIPANALLAAACLGMLVSREGKPPAPRHPLTRRLGRLGAIATLALLCGTLLTLVWQGRVEAYWLAGENAALQGHLHQAHQTLRDGLAINREHPRLWRTHGEVLLRLGLAERDGTLLLHAEKAFRNATVLSPRDHAPRLRLAEVLLRQGRATEALEEARRAIPLAPHLATAYELCGIALETLNRHKEAEAMYLSSLEKFHQRNGRIWLQAVREKIKLAQNL